MTVTLMGLDAVLQYNDGTYGTPDWTPITNVKDLTLSLSTGIADVSTRAGNGWRQEQPTLKEAEITFQMIHDPSDEGFNVIRDAFLATDPDERVVEFWITDQDPVVDSGALGFRMAMFVSQFDWGQELEEGQMIDVTLRVARTENPPAILNASVTPDP